MLKCENLPRINSTTSETQNILVKFQQNKHTPGEIQFNVLISKSIDILPPIRVYFLAV